jgi:hypothetical protein
MQSCKDFSQGLVGESGVMNRLRALVSRVAATDASVLVVGESGTGKELVAQALHAGSPRAEREFRAINCGAIPASLIESELFGFERGSFTGATRTHDGIVGQAHGGTLFLDEITEMPMDTQPPLLRFLETRRYFRVGGTRELSTDVRIVAATNRKPASAVRESRLREDPYYRLAAFPIELPPLRERGDDVVELAGTLPPATERRRRHREALLRRLAGRGTASHVAGQHPRAQARHRVRLHPRGTRRGPRHCAGVLRRPAPTRTSAAARGRHALRTLWFAIGGRRTLADRGDAAAVCGQQASRRRRLGLQREDVV